MKLYKIGLLISALLIAISQIPVASASTIKLKHVISVDKKIGKYRSECRAVTTYWNGDPAPVDKITAYLRHEKKYPARTVTETNSSKAIASYQKRGFGARKIVAFCYACFESKKYGKACTKEESVDIKKKEK